MSKRPSTKKAGRKTAAKSKPRAKPTRNAHARARKAPEILSPKKIDPRSTYEPSFCDRVIELGAEGKSKAQIARALGCSRKALYSWMTVHPEFAEAMDEAMFAAQAWWEEAGQAGLTMKGFNGSVYAYLMKNRFRGEYGDRTEIEHSGKVQTDEPEMTDLELARRIAFVFGEAMQMKPSQLQRLAAPFR